MSGGFADDMTLCLLSQKFCKTRSNCKLIMLLLYDCRNLRAYTRACNGSESCRTVGNAPYDTVSAEDQRLTSGLWAAMRLLLPATHGVIDGSIYPLPSGTFRLTKTAGGIFILLMEGCL